MLDARKIENELKGTLWQNKFFTYERLKSTQEKVRDLLKDGMSPGYIVCADEQYGGEGRFKRKWAAERGKSLTFSCIVKRISIPSLRAALSIVETIREVTPLLPSIRWPNDVIIKGRKVAGVLTESERKFMIIGIGVNLNETIFPSEISATATSIKLELGHPVSREGFLSILLKIFEKNMEREDIIQRVKENLSFINTKVRVERLDGTIEGDFMDIGEDGNLIIRETQGMIREITSSEVKFVRAINLI
jgi:BirA family biotin operon repressor/biotin-[acetyl-CoA-carboxylase] ligase